MDFRDETAPHNIFDSFLRVNHDADDLLFFFQAEDGIRDLTVTGVQTCALPISHWRGPWQTGVSPEKNLPDKVQGNIIWRAPFGCISAPLVLNERVYLINYDADKEIGRASCRERV